MLFNIPSLFPLFRFIELFILYLPYTYYFYFYLLIIISITLLIFVSFEFTVSLDKRKMKKIKSELILLPIVEIPKSLKEQEIWHPKKPRESKKPTWMEVGKLVRVWLKCEEKRIVRLEKGQLLDSMATEETLTGHQMAGEVKRG